MYLVGKAEDDWYIAMKASGGWCTRVCEIVYEHQSNTSTHTHTDAHPNTSACHCTTFETRLPVFPPGVPPLYFYIPSHTLLTMPRDNIGIIIGEAGLVPVNYVTPLVKIEAATTQGQEAAVATSVVETSQEGEEETHSQEEEGEEETSSECSSFKSSDMLQSLNSWEAAASARLEAGKEEAASEEQDASNAAGGGGKGEVGAKGNQTSGVSGKSFLDQLEEGMSD